MNREIIEESVVYYKIVETFFYAMLFFYLQQKPTHQEAVSCLVYHKTFYASINASTFRKQAFLVRILNSSLHVWRGSRSTPTPLLAHSAPQRTKTKPEHQRC